MRVIQLFAPRTTVRAHCGLPCGVYDPDQARIEIESCYKIIEKYGASEDPVFRARAIEIKEERANIAQHHLDELWHDYFKPKMLETVPGLHQLFWEASKQLSKVKEGMEIGEAQKMLEMIEQIDEAWRATGGDRATRLQRQREPAPVR